MSNGNPLEQLRRRMQSHATPTAFAALAEEYRRAGRFADAITVCREGLGRYPAYASARVTLGRALLDSGDVPAAVAELELAVAQSPDNLAAARALQSAHDALGEDAASQPVGDLPLRTLADQDTDSIPADVIARALNSGPDAPQEFGLAPDWSIPESSQPAVTADAAAPDVSSFDVRPSDLAESPTMLFVAPHLQGEEPAGIWAAPAPAPPPDAPPASDGARVFSWAIDPPDTSDLPRSADVTFAAATDSVSVWDAPTMEAPLVAVAEASSGSPLPGADSDAEPSSAPEADVAAPAANGAAAADPAAAPDPADEEASSPFWTGLFPAEAEADTPELFAGWGDAAPDTAGADRTPWADAAESEARDTWTVPDGPSATWALGDLAEAAGADATPFKDSLDTPDATPVPFANIPEPAPAPADQVGSATGVAWAGSVRSALGEVFALAGHVESLEPPTHASPAMRTAMADVALEAAIDDVASREDGTAPLLTSLEQMLAAVRARRAQLAGGASS